MQQVFMHNAWDGFDEVCRHLYLYGSVLSLIQEMDEDQVVPGYTFSGINSQQMEAETRTRYLIL